MIFRPCPNYPGFSTSKCGLIRRDAVNGKPERLRKISKGGQISDFAKAYSARRMIIDAWGKLPTELPEFVAAPPVKIAGRWTAWDTRGYCHEAGVKVRTVKQPPA